MTKSPGYECPHFETINALDALHIEAENLAAGEAVTLMEMRVLDAIAVNAEMTRDEIAASFCPERKHLASYAVDLLHKRGAIVKWQPGRCVGARTRRKATCYRLTQKGQAEIAHVTAALDSKFTTLFRSRLARDLVNALNRSAR